MWNMEYWFITKKKKKTKHYKVLPREQALAKTRDNLLRIMNEHTYVDVSSSLRNTNVWYNMSIVRVDFVLRVARSNKLFIILLDQNNLCSHMANFTWHCLEEYHVSIQRYW